jgi:hypothetical protein
MNAAEHLEDRVWKTPDSYFGFNPVGDFIVLTRHRDSCLLAKCNWESATQVLRADPYDGGLADRANAYTFVANHWAVGWVEYLMVRQDAPYEIRREAGEIVCALADYPILDEDLLSRREWEAVCEYWAYASIKERMEYLYEARISRFAARRDSLPEDPHSRLFERLRDGL